MRCSWSSLPQGWLAAQGSRRRAVHRRRGDHRGDAGGDEATAASTSRSIVTEYLTRIATFEDTLHAALAVNPRALAEADERDRERAAGKIRGPLHGIPIALKDNIHTTRHADDRRRAGVRRLRAAVRGDADGEPAGGRRDHHRQDRHDRARQLGGRRADADADQLQRRRRLRIQPLRSAPRSASGRRRPAGAGDRRIELGHRHVGQPVGGERRHRNIRIDPQPVESEHAGGHQADGRTGQPLRRHSDHGRSGHAWSAGENRWRTRRSCSARSKARRPIPNDPATQHLHAAAGARLHAVSCGATDCAAPASAFRARSSTTARRFPARPAPRGGLASRSGEADGRGHRRPQARRRRRRRPGRHPEHRRSRIRSRTTRCGGSVPARTTRAAATPTARSRSSTG